MPSLPFIRFQIFILDHLGLYLNYGRLSHGGFKSDNLKNYLLIEYFQLVLTISKIRGKLDCSSLI